MSLLTDTPLIKLLHEELKVNAHIICFKPHKEGCMMVEIFDHNHDVVAVAERRNGNYQLIKEKPTGLQ